MPCPGGSGCFASCPHHESAESGNEQRSSPRGIARIALTMMFRTTRMISVGPNQNYPGRRELKGHGQRPIRGAQRMLSPRCSVGRRLSERCGTMFPEGGRRAASAVFVNQACRLR